MRGMKLLLFLLGAGGLVLLPYSNIIYSPSSIGLFPAIILGTNFFELQVQLSEHFEVCISFFELRELVCFLFVLPFFHQQCPVLVNCKGRLSMKYLEARMQTVHNGRIKQDCVNL